MPSMPPLKMEFSWPDGILGGRAYYLQLVGTNTSVDHPWVVPEGHTVIGRVESYLIVRVDSQ